MPIQLRAILVIVFTNFVIILLSVLAEPVMCGSILNGT